MARRIPGEFVPLDVNMPSDPKVRRAGPDAELVYIRGLIYLKRTNSDGFLPEYDMAAFAVGCRNVPKSIAALVKVGLWESAERDGEPGWVCRSWLKWNASQKEIAAMRDERKAGAMRTNHGKGLHERPVSGCPDCEEVAA